MVSSVQRSNSLVIRTQVCIRLSIKWTSGPYKANEFSKLSQKVKDNTIVGEKRTCASIKL